MELRLDCADAELQLDPKPTALSALHGIARGTRETLMRVVATRDKKEYDPCTWRTIAARLE